MKIQYSNCYIQMHSDNVEMLKLASAALEFFTDYFKNKEKILETTTNEVRVWRVCECLGRQQERVHWMLS